MRSFLGTMLAVLLISISVTAQNTNSSGTTAAVKTSNSNAGAKRPPVFRATKDQIMQAQTVLKQKGLYSGEATGKLDDATRAGLKKYQEGENVRAAGTLNRITLEKMGIDLTDKQKLIPASESSMMPEAKSTEEKTPGGKVFRATKDQIMQAQKMLKDKNLYVGEQAGAMTDDFRASLKKYQEAEKIKSTGTLNRETLEKMGIALTDKQKTP